MRRHSGATLPPIAVRRAAPKKFLTHLIRCAQNARSRSFGEYFQSSTGSIPTSLNAVVVGILAGYLEEHGGFNKWLKAKARAPSAQRSAPEWTFHSVSPW